MGIRIKKFIAPLFFPLSISLEFLLIGIYLLLFSKRQTSGKVFVVFGFLLIVGQVTKFLPTNCLSR